MLVAGTIAFDIVALVAQLPDPDTAVRAEHLDQRPGGCGGNVARGLGRLGHQPQLLSAVGLDFAESGYEAELQAEGVDLAGLIYDQELPTARAFTATDHDERQLIVYHEGATPAMQHIGPREAALGHFAPGELPAYPALMSACRTVTFDPGQELFHGDEEAVRACLEHTDVLLCNHHESDRLTEIAGELDQIVHRVGAVVVRDPDGQEIHTTEGVQRVPAAPADVVDPTGAGDAHSAGVVHGLSEGWDLERSCRFGSVLAASVVEHRGAQEGLPTLEDARQRYEDAYGEPP